MKQTDKSALASRLGGIGMVAPTLAEGQPGQMENVRDIEIITGEILEAKRVGGEAVLTIGRGLIEAKAMLEHGEWLPWLTERVEFSERQAQRLMRIAREYENPTLVSDLGARKALQLLALPESEREGFLAETHQVNGEEKAVIDMTSRELEKAIKERDEARKAAEQAKVDASAAAEDRAAMEQSLKVANELLDSAKMDLEQVRTRESALLKQLKELRDAPVEVAVMDVDQAKLDAARAEGEAAKAAEIEALQAKLDKAQAAKKSYEEQCKEAEKALADVKARLDAATKSQKSAAAMADLDIAKFKVYFDQIIETVNKMSGLLIKTRGREDHTAADKLSQAMAALGDKIKETAR